MHEDAGRVQHAAQRRPPRAGELLESRIDERAGVAARPDLLARSLESRARRRQRELVRLRGQALVAQQLVDRGQIAELHAASVGTSSRSSAVSDAAALAPTSSTASWSIFSGRTPAAMFVTTEIPRQRMPI